MALWQDDLKRCFFCTPQTFWNDVRKGAEGWALFRQAAGLLW